MRLFWALGLALFLMGGCGDVVDPISVYDKIANLTGDGTNGKTVYDSNCAGCHGADGKSGAAGPNVVEGALTALTVSEMAQAVVDGKGVMPAFSQLSNQEIADVIAYVKGPLAGK